MAKRIQAYTLLERVGRGSTGQVFKAVHDYKPGQYAVKVIDNKILQDCPKTQQCLFNEVKILSKIGPNQNIVTFFEMLRTKNNHYFVYEFCNGGSLYDILRKEKNLEQIKAVTYLKQILNAYKTLNKHNVLHRDIKPDNILFHNGCLKLADFGLCKTLESQQVMTRTMLGSPIYMSPQILKGEAYTSKSDIWSLGVVLYEMVFGICPFVSNSIAGLVTKMEENLRLQFATGFQISEKLENVLKRMLVKDQEARISWTELFAQFGLIQGQEYKARNMQKKPSLCLLENLSMPLPKRESKVENSSWLPQKQNKTYFPSSKYLQYLKKSPYQSPSNLRNSLQQNKHSASIQKFSTYYSCLKNSHQIPLCNRNTQSKLIIHKTTKPYKPTKQPAQPSSFLQHLHLTSPSLDTPALDEKQKIKTQAQQIITKLENLHMQFVQVSAFCEQLMKSRNKDNLLDILELLTNLRAKLGQFSVQIGKINIGGSHDDLETMVNYEIIGVEETLKCLSYCINGEGTPTKTSSFVKIKQEIVKSPRKLANPALQLCNERINSVII